MGKSTASRQAAFRARKSAEGLVSISVLVPAAQAGSLALLASRLRDDRDLEIATLRSARTGRLVKI